MNLNDYASDLTKREGKKESLSVAQVKEVLKLVNEDLWGIPYLLIGFKKKRPEAGELATLTVVAIAAGVFALFTFIPQINPINLLQGGGKPAAVTKLPDEEAWKEQQLYERPVDVGVNPATGKTVVGYERYRTFGAGSARRAPRYSYGEQIVNFLAGATNLTIGLVVFGGAFLFFVLGITPGMIWRRAKIRAEEVAEKERLEKERYEKALKQTVAGIRSISDKGAYEAVTGELAKSQDADVKRTIDVVKADLHA